MSKTEGELQSWEMEIATLITEAMQAGIAVWNLEQVKSLPPEAIASVMAKLQQPFVLKIFAIVHQQLAEAKSSS